MKTVCVVGGGFAGLEAALRLDDALGARRNVRLVLVNDGDRFTYTPLLADVAAASMTMRSVTVRLAAALSGTRCEVMRDRVVGVDVDAGRVVGELGEVAFDYAVLAVGSEVDFGACGHLEARAMPLRTVRDAMRIKAHVLLAFRQAVGERLSDEALASRLTFTVVGGGLRGVELASELAQGVAASLLPRVPPRVREAFKVRLVEARPALLPRFSGRVQAQAREVLEALGVEVRLGARVTDADGSAVVLDGGERVAGEHLLWAGGMRPPAWLGASGLPVTASGALDVDATLTLEGARSVFAAGSCAQWINPDVPAPALSWVSIQQGASAADNVMRAMVGSRRLPFEFSVPEQVAEWILRGRLERVAPPRKTSIAGSLSALAARAAWRAAHVAQTPTAVKKMAIFADWTDKLVRGREWDRVPLAPR